MRRYAHPNLSRIKLAAVMQALSDPCRITILRALLKPKNAELACSEIPLRISKATRSHHFDVLREAGLIATRCEGTKCLSSVRRREIEARFPGLLKMISAEAR